MRGRLTALMLVTGVPACSGAQGAAEGWPAPEQGESAPVASTPEATTVQPGAPGESSRIISKDDLSAVGSPPYSPADVRFMQGMIPHHAQALDMTALVPDRTDDPGFRRLALRMEISQKDEIALMTRWLRVRGEAVPAPDAHRGQDAVMMPGMLSPQQIEQLAAASGVEFERLFLELMIQHHEGALEMVANLFATRGGGQESEIFQFATDVDADQRMEIGRMRGMLEGRE